MKISIRWMIKRDIPEIMEIENEAFQFTWTENDFAKILRTKNTIAWTIEEKEKIVGFLIYELLGYRINILNIAVKPSRQRKKIGKQIIEKLMQKLSLNKRVAIDVYVRESNLNAQLFFKSLEFKAVHVEREYYEDSGEDGYLMRYLLPDAEYREEEPHKEDDEDSFLD